jgi:hypothetical protein
LWRRNCPGGYQYGSRFAQSEVEAGRFDALENMNTKICLRFTAVVVFFPLALSNVVSAQDVPVAGNLLMQNSTPTNGNILKDGVRFIHNFGAANTFIGKNAGNLTMVGGGNTGSGESALSNNSSGNFNTGNGYFALQNNAGGSNNTGAGYQALESNTTGSFNTATGNLALDGNTTGERTPPVGRARLPWAREATTLALGTGRFLTTSGAVSTLL